MKNPQVQTEKMTVMGYQSSYPVYNELSDTPVSIKSIEEEFVSRLALVEDLHKRFHFMITELKTSGLKVEEE